MKTLNRACETLDNLSQYCFGANSREGKRRLHEKGLTRTSKPHVSGLRRDHGPLKCSVMERRAGNFLGKKSWLGLGINTCEGIYVSTGKTQSPLGYHMTLFPGLD